MNDSAPAQCDAHSEPEGAGEAACPLCGNRISSEELARIKAKIREDLEVHTRERIERITAQKDREREEALVAHESELRKVLAEEAARETAEVIRQSREQVSEQHQRQLGERDEIQRMLEQHVLQLETKALEMQEREEAAAKDASEQLMAVATERDQALEALRSVQATETEMRTKIEAEVAAKNDARFQELSRNVEQERAAKEERESALRLLSEEHERRMREEKESREVALREQAKVHEQRMKDVDAAKAADLQRQRETLETEQKLKLVEKDQEANRDRERWQKKVAELERQLQNKTSNQLGDITQIHVLDSLRNAFPDDRITPIAKGAPGADIRHEVLYKGAVCGKILVDAKNHKQWRYEFVTKLQADRRAEQANYAIVATAEFPKEKRDLCIEDDVIVIRPDRIVPVVDILRRVLIQMHLQRLTVRERTAKAQKVYDLIMSDQFREHLGRLNKIAEKLDGIEVDEKREHDLTWKKRGQLITSLAAIPREIDNAITAIIEE